MTTEKQRNVVNQIATRETGNFSIDSRDIDSIRMNNDPRSFAASCPDSVIIGQSSLNAACRSLDSSPIKMENCLFNFPIPTPRTWTIMVEPITNQAAGVPQLQHWKPTSTRQKKDVSMLTNIPLDYDGSRSSQSSPSWASSAEASPRKKRRNRIYLNGTCIDNGGTLNSNVSKIAKSKCAGPKIFTFVTDKRMPASAVDSTNSSPMPGEDSGSSTKRKSRRNAKKFLTFHQLEFDSETLKPFDRSIFVTGNLDEKSKSTPNEPSKLTNQTLIEAAEILLELQTHSPLDPIMHEAMQIGPTISSTS